METMVAVRKSIAQTAYAKQCKPTDDSEHQNDLLLSSPRSVAWQEPGQPQIDENDLQNDLQQRNPEPSFGYPLANSYFLQRIQDLENSQKKLLEENHELQQEMDKAYIRFDKEYDPLKRERDILFCENETLRKELDAVSLERDKYHKDVIAMQDKQTILHNERNFYRQKVDELINRLRQQKSFLKDIERQHQQQKTCNNKNGSKNLIESGVIESATEKKLIHDHSKESPRTQKRKQFQESRVEQQDLQSSTKISNQNLQQQTDHNMVASIGSSSFSKIGVVVSSEANAEKSRVHPSTSQLLFDKGLKEAQEGTPSNVNTQHTTSTATVAIPSKKLAPNVNNIDLSPIRPCNPTVDNNNSNLNTKTIEELTALNIKKKSLQLSPRLSTGQKQADPIKKGVNPSSKPESLPRLTKKCVSPSDKILESSQRSKATASVVTKAKRICIQSSKSVVPKKEVLPKKTGEQTDFASFLFPTSHAYKTKKGNVSTVFALLQNPKTKAEGYRLLKLGSELQSLSKNLEKAQKDFGTFETGIQTEKSIINQMKAKIENDENKFLFLANWTRTWNRTDDNEATLLGTTADKVERPKQKRREANEKRRKNAEKKQAENDLKLFKSRLQASEEALDDYQKNAQIAKSRVFALASNIDAVKAKMALDMEMLKTNSPADTAILSAANYLTDVSIELCRSLQELEKHQNVTNHVGKPTAENIASLDDARSKLKKLRRWKWISTPEQLQIIKTEREQLATAKTKKQKEKAQKLLDERLRSQKEMEQKIAGRIKKTENEIKEHEKKLHSETALNRAKSSVCKQEGEVKTASIGLLALMDNSTLRDHDITSFSLDINAAKNERELTLLLASVAAGDLETVIMCLDLNADPNQLNENGITPLVVASHLGFDEIADCLSNHGARVEDDANSDWNSVLDKQQCAPRHVQDWMNTLKIAEQAAVSVEDLFENAEKLEGSEETRMMELTTGMREKLPLGFFDASLENARPHRGSMKRIVLLERDILSWLQGSGANSDEKSNFIDMLRALIPGQENEAFEISRRSVVGIKNSYEILGVRISKSKMAIFSPFCSSEVDGQFTVGVLVWAVVPETRASLYKTLIESTEFLRNKVESDDRFPKIRQAVLPLGKDMPLLDLTSTSIHTSRPMDLFSVDIDSELDSLGNPEFVPDKRVLDSDKRLADAIFGKSNEAEALANKSLLSESRPDMSTQLFGGAGTGKTLLITKKLVSDDVHEHLLVVSRLPRLVSAIKAKVGGERETRNITFSTYDDLCSKLAKTVDSEGGHDVHFPVFSKVQYGDTLASTSFQKFVDFISPREKKCMKQHRIENATLWAGLRTIKSNILCAKNLRHLSRQEYLQLPTVFGFGTSQREVVYDLFEVYQKWLKKDGHKWDEADRVLFILKNGNAVFSESIFLSWQDRYYQGLGEGLVDEDGVPKKPYFYHKVYVDEAQDFSELDLALFLRMSAGIRSIFLAADPAQSVEVGLMMRNGTVNDVYHASIDETMGIQVKDALQRLEMHTNHRTHQSNLKLSKAVRTMLTRSFKVPGTKENALINGPMPEALLVSSLDDLADNRTFRGPGVVFLAPDEKVDAIKEAFNKKGIMNDVFGVREAKGLEFDSVALLGFLAYFEHRNSASEWRNMILWLFSSKGITTTESAEVIQIGQGHGRGQKLESCDYLLSHPEVGDEAMLLYTAITRSRNRVYLIELEEDGVHRRKGEKVFADFVFRCFQQLHLVQTVSQIDEGRVEMTPQEHKARGVLLITQAIDVARKSSSTNEIRSKFVEARKRFLPAFGNDKVLYDLATKHFVAILLKGELLRSMQMFFDSYSGSYVLEGKFVEVLAFEKLFIRFVNLAAWDTFLIDDFHEIMDLVEEMFLGTPFIRLAAFCSQLRAAHSEWSQDIRE